MVSALLKYKIIYSLIILTGGVCISTLWITLPNIEKAHCWDITGFSITAMLYLASDIMRTEAVATGLADADVYKFVFISEAIFYLVVYFWVNSIGDFFANTTVIRKRIWLVFTVLIILITKNISLYRHVLSEEADFLGSPGGVWRIVLTCIFIVYTLLVLGIAIRYIIYSVKSIRKKSELKTIWLALIASCLLAIYIIQCFAWDFSRAWPDLLSYADLNRMDPLGYCFAIVNIVALVLMQDYRRHKKSESQSDEDENNRAETIGEQYGLSNREKEVLELMLKGYDNTYISESLFISPNTLRHHISSIYRKTGADNRIELLMMKDSDIK